MPCSSSPHTETKNSRHAREQNDLDITLASSSECSWGARSPIVPHAHQQNSKKPTKGKQRRSKKQKEKMRNKQKQDEKSKGVR
jgi:hypothetical protein